jgi:hypothetical protein
MNEFLKDVFIKDMAEVNRVEGITEEYVWYNSKLLINKMSSWQTEFEKVVMVMEARHKEHLKIISNLLDEIKKLKEENNELKRSGDHINSGQGNNQAG